MQVTSFPYATVVRCMIDHGNSKHTVSLGALARGNPGTSEEAWEDEFDRQATLVSLTPAEAPDDE